MDPFLFQINKKPKSKGKPGLPKIPTHNAQVTRDGVLGDYNNFRDTKKNNDPNMALMILSTDILQDLNDEGWPVKPGDLGENLTLSNIDYSVIAPAQKYKIGGIEIDHDKGAVGHSDADVVIHVICDAFLGALSLGDIGKHFPDTDNIYKGIDSKILLKKVMKLVKEEKCQISNVDVTILLQKPKLRNFIDSKISFIPLK